MHFVFSHGVALGTLPKLGHLGPQPRKTSIPNTSWSVFQLKTRTRLETLSGAGMEASVAMVSVTFRLSVSGG